MNLPHDRTKPVDPILDLLRPAMSRTAGSAAATRASNRAANRAALESAAYPAGRRTKRWMVVLSGGALGLFTVVSGTVGAASRITFGPSFGPTIADELPATRPTTGPAYQPSVVFGEPVDEPIYIPASIPMARSGGRAVDPRVAVKFFPQFAEPYAMPTFDVSPRGQHFVATPRPATVRPVVFTVGNVTPARAVTPATMPVRKLDVAQTAAQTAAPKVEAWPEAAAAAPLAIDGLAADGSLAMTVNKTRIMKTALPVSRVSVAQPDVAEVSRLDDRTLLVTAKTAGNTQLIIWGQEAPAAPGQAGQPSEQNRVVDVNVALDLKAVKDQVATIFPGREISVGSLNGAIVLRGPVPNLKTAEQVEAVASPFGRVVNFLEVRGGQQVMLQVQFAEVSRQVNNELGVSFGISDGVFNFGSNTGGAGVGAALGGTGGNALSIPVGASPTNLFGGGVIGGTAFNVFVQALRQNNLLRVLAQPNLVVTSGQEGSFLAGGEFPIPVPQPGAGGGTGITIEYKEFGVRLNFTPVVLGDGRIRLKLSPEVSDLDYTAAVVLAGIRVPALRKRSLTTTVELGEGQTFAVGGLLDSSLAANRDAVPLLGDLPVIGALFRSTRYQRRETELVVLITPTLVEAMNPDQVPPLPGVGEGVPDDIALFVGGDIETPRKDEPMKADPSRPAATFEGRRGFQPAPAAPASVK